MSKYLQAAKAPYKGISLCLSDKKLRKLSSKPWLIGLFSWPLSVAFAFFSHPHLLDLIDTNSLSWWAPVWNWCAGFLAAGLLFALSLFLSICLLFIFSGVFQTSIAREVFQQMRVKLPPEDQGMARDAGRTIWVETAKLFWIVPLTITAFLLGLLPFLTPFALIITSWLLGFQFMDIALDNLRFGALRRIRFCLKHFFKTSIFGAVLVICWAVPFLGILIAPGAAAGAAWLVAKCELVELLPENPNND